MRALRTTLTVTVSVLTGIGLLVLLSRLSPDAESGRFAAGATSVPSRPTSGEETPSSTHASRPEVRAADTILLVPPGGAAADLVLLEDGGWAVPPSTRTSGPASKPAALTLALPGSLTSLSPKARACLVDFLESARPRPAVRLPEAASPAEREELSRLLAWIR